jgi:hypothetical protein
LVVAEPDLAVNEGEVDDVVDEGLCSASGFGNGEDLKREEKVRRVRIKTRKRKGGRT